MWRAVTAAMGCSRAASAPPSTTTRKRAWVRRGSRRVANEALAKSASFPWACPACFKKGVAAVQRAALKPTGQRAAGAKKPRKKRAKK